MRSYHTLARLYLDQKLHINGTLDLDKSQAHYLGTVLRKRIGESVRVFNADYGEWRAQLVALGKKGAQLSIEEPLRPPTACPDIWLCFAPIKKQRTMFIVEKATELGVATLVPTITERTQFPKINLDKLHTQIIEAAEQTERMDLPHLKPSMKLYDMLEQWDASRTLIFADEASEGEAEGSLLDTLKNTQAPSAILIGPEGGFSPQERAHLRAQDFVISVSLGPRILRADTACVSMLTLWQSMNGDWDV